ncbi:hypothetical protein MTR67_001869 [Solanum verrucosum]|uniref:Uncharacterized protein n=1 Tax=Solanum verrucosum TaxID=315347 RepID=A0AAF0T885_SOLVR|nr:hypothetical protein MTR67_001869 [Solanum verrucosum]
MINFKRGEEILPQDVIFIKRL